MTEDPLGTALRGLRDRITAGATAPPAASMRAHATRWRRVRRATAAGAVVAAVAAAAFGGVTLLQPTASPPVPPVEVPPGPVTPSPRPSPRPVVPLDDPITAVEWEAATITFPPRDGCPSGEITFAPAQPSFHALGVPPEGYPAIALSPPAGYGDLTGDGRAEAVVLASCVPTEAGFDGQHFSDLLIVTRDDTGTLTGLGWVPAEDAAFTSVWITGDGRLLTELVPEGTTFLPGRAASYQWDGERMIGGEPAPGYPTIVPLDADRLGPPVRLGAVAGGLGCPDAELRFAREAPGWSGVADAGGARYSIPDRFEFIQKYLFDLDNTGEPLLVATLGCTREGGHAAAGLAVFERFGEGWRGISVVTSSDGQQPTGWRLEEDGLFAVRWPGPDEQTTEIEARYRWTGTVLERVDR